MKTIIRDITTKMSDRHFAETEISMTVLGRIDTKALFDSDFDDLFPGKVIVKCQHCTQWGARKSACKHCGAPID